MLGSKRRLMIARSANSLILSIQLLAFCLALSQTSNAQEVPPTSGVSMGKEQAGDAIELRFLAADSTGNPIADLRAEELALRVNNEPRKIVSLLPANDEPRTIGVFFDTSGSRRFDKVIIKEVQATAKFLGAIWHRGDGGFVVAFDDSPRTLAKPTTDLQHIQAALQTIPDEGARGGTALYDALCSIRFGPQAGGREKVFVIVSDFEDNSSRKSKEEMIRTLQKEGVRLFVLLRGFENDKRHDSFPHDQKLAKEVTEKTGGEVFVVTSQRELDAAFHRLIGELHGAYRLTYEPSMLGNTVQKQELQTNHRDANLLYAKN